MTAVSSLPSLRNSQTFPDSYEDADGLESVDDAVKVDEQHSLGNEDIASVEDTRLAMLHAGKRSTSNTAPTSVECCGNSEYGLLIYRFEAIPMNRENAIKNCQRNGGELAAPLNMKEFIVLENFVRPLLQSRHAAYIGYNDVEEEGKFVDNNGHPAAINNFRTHEPNNVHNEDCLVITADGKFNDIPCSTGRTSICEFRIHGY
ncbi:mannose-binding protein C-like [Sycon ciliatum]|uniref:mannose-binding protein C-like n=1 Tax=Sycon ciliatum TaxID=27933 RepID=UPI0031F62B2A